MDLAIERHVVIPAGQPNGGVSLQFDGEYVLFGLLIEGTRIIGRATVEEAEAMGVGFIQLAQKAKDARAAQVKPASSLVLNGVGRG